ncbi:MAG: hypothetical protein J2P25_18500 [Nocardiopsaceae bacterium]|nr:hypothetical protein [Nocardiopsaceae bacterium]
MPGFPDADPGAISDLADRLKTIGTSMDGVGQDTVGLRGSVMGSQQWQGKASEGWWTVVTARIGDAELTQEVMDGVAATLSGLASDLDAERRTYDKLSDDLLSKQQPVLGGPEPYSVSAPDPSVQKAMDACAARAAGLLEDAARQLLRYAALAGDIQATPAADRTPGVAAGADRHGASLGLLQALLGSVRDNQIAGSKFEQAVLEALGIPKNTMTWRPGIPFEGMKFTPGGLPRGTIVDGQGANFLLELKGTQDLKQTYQLMLQERQAEGTGRPLWIIKQGPWKADPSVVQAAEDTGGGVLYTGDNGKTFTDAQGHQVQVKYDKGSNSIEVKGYSSEFPRAGDGSGGDGGADSAPPPDPDAPQSPVEPGIAGAPPPPPEPPRMPEPEPWEFPEL